MSFLREFLAFIVARRKFWLLPAMLAAVIFGGLLVLTKGTVVAPFIYALF